MVQQDHLINHRPTRKPLLTANHHPLRLEWAQRWQNLTTAHWQHVIFGDESRFQLHLVDSRLRLCRLLDECFQERCGAFRFQTGGGSIHVWGAFHSGAKSLLLLPNRHLTDELYTSILWSTSMSFAREHFGDNYCYQDYNITPHRVRIVFHFLLQGNVTKMEQPARWLHCNPIKHIWDGLSREITSMNNLPQNHGELRQALLDNWGEIHV